VEQGSHQELLARGGLYARLWAHQSGGFLGEFESGGAHEPDGDVVTALVDPVQPPGVAEASRRDVHMPPEDGPVRLV
jgi:hypothetical protein